MNYKKAYKNLIETRLHRGYKKKLGYELHHIIPKCPSYNGTDNLDNLVLLTPREHFIAHLLLLKMADSKNKKEKMANALHMMMATRDGELTKCSRLYEYARLQYSKYHNSKTEKFRIDQSARSKEVMKDRIYITDGIINKTIKYYDLDKYLTLGFYRGMTKTQAMIQADKRKRGAFHGKIKITPELYTEIINFYNLQPAVTIIVNKDGKRRNGKTTSYEREFSKQYNNKFGLSDVAVYNIVTGKYTNNAIRK